MDQEIDSVLFILTNVLCWSEIMNQRWIEILLLLKLPAEDKYCAFIYFSRINTKGVVGQAWVQVSGTLPSAVGSVLLVGLE